jgi:hypothetical protein
MGHQIPCLPRTGKYPMTNNPPSPPLAKGGDLRWIGSFEIVARNLFGICNLEFGILICCNRLGEAI